MKLGNVSKPPNLYCPSIVALIALLLSLLPGCKQQVEVPASIRKLETPKRISFRTKFKNTSPDVAYVEDAVCAECHGDIAQQYADHPMANSLTPAHPSAVIAEFGDENRSRFQSSSFRYEARLDEAGRPVHSRRLVGTDVPLPKEEYPIAYFVGSGQKGRSYLIDRDGRFFMSPLTWYPNKQIWDLSPGYEHNDLGFTRPVLEDCLFCHSNRANRQPNTKNQYASVPFEGYGIGCQRCHGPGQLHVQRHRAGMGVSGEYDTTIANPAHMVPAVREAVCQQCHLAGAARVLQAGKNRFDFRPGMPLDRVLATFVVRGAPDNQDKSFVGQVEQMYASRCFVGSNGTLGCTSCHDPHAQPNKTHRLRFYRERCLRCHTEAACGLPEESRQNEQGFDDCIACHMPRVSTEVPHSSSTNHRIPRRPDDSWQGSTLARLGPVAPFPTRVLPADSLNASRNRAIALLEASQYHADQVSSQMLRDLVGPLWQVVAKNPKDIGAQEALGDILLRFGDADALIAYRAVLNQTPNREHSLVQLASTLSKLRRTDQAIEAWQDVERLNPWNVGYALKRIQTFEQARQWDQAYHQAWAGTKRFPTSARIWRHLVVDSLATNRTQQAESALEVLVRFNKTQEAAVRAWYQQQLQRDF